MKISYKSAGIVYGNLWGGGEGAYSARRLTADTKEELIEKARIGIGNGSLDGGMGYESLIGARLIITKTSTVEIEGKLFSNEESEIYFVGELSDEQIFFLDECEI